MSRKKEHHEEHADETWLLPYSDMLTLLLALFIVMFAMSELDKAKFQAISSEFNIIFAGGTGVLENGTTLPPPIPVPGGQSQGEIEDNMMNEIKVRLEDKVESQGYTDKVKINLNGEGLEVAIQDIALFNSGDAVILKEAAPLLGEISNMLNDLDNDIRIVGHSDNVPIRNSKFRSNWDLSATRAINVMNFMVENGGLKPEKFSIQAYGEYKPKYDNTTEEGRAKNRRVEIFIVRKYQMDGDKNTQAENKN
ncbi:MAG TPA: flagellar motor protein MotB [Negativicutes bacterium]|nr:flagellar motor protein MotB [Negativicutes bacterium]